jgi:hypothetical protein
MKIFKAMMTATALLMVFSLVQAVAPQNAKAAAQPVVVLQTSEGAITIELWPDKAPLTVKNFLTYVGEGFYSGSIFFQTRECKALMDPCLRKSLISVYCIIKTFYCIIKLFII